MNSPITTKLEKQQNNQKKKIAPIAIIENQS